MGLTTRTTVLSSNLAKGHVISKYLGLQMVSVLQTLKTSHQFVWLALEVAQQFSSKGNVYSPSLLFAPLAMY
jgi:hypothetical protein